jgi:hypothetical protein
VARIADAIGACAATGHIDDLREALGDAEIDVFATVENPAGLEPPSGGFRPLARILKLPCG